jgi:glycosyltransferase involved in cell wall biosynthesis
VNATAVSVVVPTRDRPAALERCLSALARQTAPGLEIIVVDDGSDDPAAVRTVVARTAPAARLIRGTGEGPAAARNIGVRAATGAVVCFTDDDCMPQPDWAQRLAAACATNGAAAGTTRADEAAGSAAAASQLITHLLTVTSLDGAHGALGFAPSCNLGCAAPLARRLPFDPSFPRAAGEDRDWCARLGEAGATLRFVPDAVVLHRPQLGLRSLLRQQRRYGRGAVLYRTGGDERRLAGALFYRRLAREATRAGAGIAALTVLAQVGIAAGALQELALRLARGEKAASARRAAGAATSS